MPRQYRVLDCRTGVDEADGTRSVRRQPRGRRLGCGVSASYSVALNALRVGVRKNPTAAMSITARIPSVR